ATVDAGLFLIISAPGIPRQVHQNHRQCVGDLSISPDKGPFPYGNSGKQLAETGLVENVDMSPRRIYLAAVLAGGLVDPRVLTKRHPHHDLMPGHSHQLTASLLNSGDVLQNLGTQDAVKAVMGEGQAGNVARDGIYPG